MQTNLLLNLKLEKPHKGDTMEKKNDGKEVGLKEWDFVECKTCGAHVAVVTVYRKEGNSFVPFTGPIHHVCQHVDGESNK